MTRRKLFGFSLLCAALGFALSMPNATTAQPKDAPLKLGMVKSFFNDLPEVIIGIVTDPFSKLMKETTGFDGTLSYTEDAFGTAAKLDANQLQFGVFHGHEFAWVQKKYPKLQPLMVVVNKQHDVRAFVIVPKNSTAKTIADLRGKKIDMPMGTKEHCRIFLAKQCGDNAQSDLKTFFGSIVKSETYINGLDDLCKGTSDAVVIDSISLAFYKDIKLPVYSKNLRVLEQSDEFPSAMIAYKEGGISEATVKQFRDGLLKAHLNVGGKEMMAMWGIEAFETPPPTFTKSLADALKAYPTPR
jgi:ABC-type phosphate/phosphonate transport system substrate-binding protein